jgi:hypothetical protein
MGCRRVSDLQRPSECRLWRPLLLLSYLMATVQVAGCYFTLVRPYINTSMYEAGAERLPFQTRVLMMPLMRWAHHSQWAAASAAFLSHSRFWYLKPAEPEAMVQLWINIASLMAAGYATQQIYRGARESSGTPSGFLEPFVYPLFLMLCAVQYILHTIQNFRFLYDLPGVAFFAVGLYLIYFRRHPLLFAGLFVIATLNRETTLLLLPFYMLSEATRGANFAWKKTISPAALSVVVPLAALWLSWHFYIFHVFKHNISEYYPRVSLNLYTLVHPRYWPQLLSAGGYVLPFLILFRKRIADPQLRAWLWVLPLWLGFMFFWGILVETRVFGELISYLTCIAMLVAEDRITASIHRQARGSSQFPLAAVPNLLIAPDEIEEAA